MPILKREEYSEFWCQKALIKSKLLEKKTLDKDQFACLFSNSFWRKAADDSTVFFKLWSTESFRGYLDGSEIGREGAMQALGTPFLLYMAAQN